MAFFFLFLKFFYSLLFLGVGLCGRKKKGGCGGGGGGEGGVGFGGVFFVTLELRRKKGKSIKFSNGFIYLELIN